MTMAIVDDYKDLAALGLSTTQFTKDAGRPSQGGSYPDIEGDLTPPIWGSDEFKICGKVIYVSLKDEDPYRYGRARGVWWRCFPFGSGRVIRVEDPTVLQELEEWFGKREEVEGWYRDQRRGIGDMTTQNTYSFDPLDPCPDVVNSLLHQAANAEESADYFDQEDDSLRHQARESMERAERHRAHAFALRAAAEKLAG
jgi:hypothetical protein